MKTGTAASKSKNDPFSQRGMLSSAVDEEPVNVDLCAANLSRTISLFGSNLTIFTFVLVFLFPRYVSDQLNGVLFQVTLATSLLAMFLFVISGISYFEVIAFADQSIEKKKALIRRGDSFFVMGLMISTAMPTLILFTLPGLLLVAMIAVVIWTLCVGFIVEQGQKLLHS